MLETTERCYELKELDKVLKNWELIHTDLWSSGRLGVLIALGPRV